MCMILIGNKKLPLSIVVLKSWAALIISGQFAIGKHESVLSSAT